jgi:hypothetical protein
MSPATVRVARRRARTRRQLLLADRRLQRQDATNTACGATTETDTEWPSSGRHARMVAAFG